MPWAHKYGSLGVHNHDCVSIRLFRVITTAKGPVLPMIVPDWLLVESVRAVEYPIIFNLDAHI